MNAASLPAGCTRTPRIRLAVMLASSAWLGCSSLTADVCEERCRCESCSDRDREACEIAVDAELDVYDVYDCSDEASAAYECAVDRGYCRDGHWGYEEACPLEHDDLEWCVSRSSSVHGAPGPGPD